jgi:hypothetical protein
METILLRKLSLKSILNFGQYNGLSVQQIIDLNKQQYLRWVYYNYEGLSFIDEIFDLIYLKDENKINKPGKNPDLHIQIEGEHDKKRYGIEGIVKEKHVKKNFKMKIAKRVCFEKKFYSRSSMQSRNHGH